MSGDFMDGRLCSIDSYFETWRVFPFEEFCPKRLCTGLRCSFSMYWCYVIEAGYWKAYTRGYPDKKPWDKYGWYVDIDAHRTSLAKPLDPLVLRPRFPGVYWVYLSDEDKWAEAKYDRQLNLFFCNETVCVPDWFIPIPRPDGFLVGGMAVIDEWEG